MNNTTDFHGIQATEPRGVPWRVGLAPGARVVIGVQQQLPATRLVLQPGVQIERMELTTE